MKIPYTLSIVLLILSSSTAAQSFAERGYEDGKNGIDIRYLSAENFAQYEQGYNQGLSDYCRIDNATKLGKQGAIYNGVCDHHNDDLIDFKTAYEKAFQQYQQGKWLMLADRNWY